MSSVFDTAVAQIATGQSFAQWHKPTTAKGDTTPKRKPNGGTAPMQAQILALFKPDAWLKRAEIADELGLDIAAVKPHIGKLIASGELIATGSTKSRAFALPGTAAPEGETKPPKPETKARKSATKTPPFKTKALPPKTAPCNVTPFTPAMTADKRMVIVGGTEPLLFSVEQTQSIADLVFENFEAA